MGCGMLLADQCYNRDNYNVYAEFQVYQIKELGHSILIWWGLFDKSIMSVSTKDIMTLE